MINHFIRKKKTILNKIDESNSKKKNSEFQSFTSNSKVVKIVFTAVLYQF